MADELPIEIITQIFHYLSLADRNEASLVNRHWFEASLDPSLRRDTVVTFRIQNLTKPAFGLGQRKISNLILEDVDSSTHSRLILLETCRNAGPYLESLSLRGSDITEKTFVTLISNCTNLAKLDLSSCNGLFMTGQILSNDGDKKLVKNALKNVRELDLSSIRYLSDQTFNRLVDLIEHLEKLSLSSARISSYSSYSSKSESSSNLLTLSNLLDFMKLNAESFRSIDLSRSSVNDDSLNLIAGIANLDLRELIMQGCRQVTDSGLSAFFKNQSNLELIDLDSCPEAGNGTILCASKYLKNMKYLNMKQSRLITDAGFVGVSRITSLKHLDVTGASRISVEGLNKALSPSLTNLRTLVLSGVLTVTDKVVMGICMNLKELTHLDISSCFEITDTSLHSISLNLRKLKHLDISWCKKISDLGLLGLLPDEHKHDDDEHTGCRCTRSCDPKDVFRKPLPLEAQALPKAEDIEGLQNMRNLNADKDDLVITNLKNLRFLGLRSVPKITDISLSKVLRFRELKTLDLSLSGLQVTDETLVAISHYLPSLEALLLSRCKSITDDGLICVLTKLTRLVKLDISNCDKITDDSLLVIMQRCKKLRYLDVSYCTKITNDGIDKLEKCLPMLRNCHKRYIGGEYEQNDVLDTATKKNGIKKNGFFK